MRNHMLCISRSTGFRMTCPRDFAAIVRGGKGKMPAFKGIKDQEIADLLAHLRRL